MLLLVAPDISRSEHQDFAPQSLFKNRDYIHVGCCRLHASCKVVLWPARALWATSAGLPECTKPVTATIASW